MTALRLILANAALAAIAVGLLLVLAPGASAAPCAHRSAAHTAEHGGLHADSRWHVANGELPTCEADQASSRSSDDDGDDRKSRYCRKRWFC